MSSPAYRHRGRAPPDSSRDAWVVETSASEGQDFSEREAKSDEVGQAALSTKDRDFPPLQRGPSCEASFDDTPSKAPATMFFRPRSLQRPQAPVSSPLQTPAHAKKLLLKSCMGPASKNGTDPVRDEGQWTAQNPRIRGEQRAPRGPDAAQNHSRVVVTVTQPAARIPRSHMQITVPHATSKRMVVVRDIPLLLALVLAMIAVSQLPNRVLAGNNIQGRGPRQAPGGFVNLAYDPSGPTRRSPSPVRRSPPTSPPTTTTPSTNTLRRCSSEHAKMAKTLEIYIC
ncbi:hypothetical protein MRX96_030693 [Rhipicephalus microplus]